MSLIRRASANLFRHVMKMTSVQKRGLNHVEANHASYEYLNEKFLCMLSSDDIDGWDIRQVFNDMVGVDMVPEPKTIVAGLHACRRVNDYALAVRFIETIKDKCGNHVDVIYPYIIQEISPTLCELGIDTPEALGYDKPELWLENSTDME